MAFTSLRKRILALVATAAVASVALAGCAATESASESDFGKLDVQFSWIKNAEFAGITRTKMRVVDNHCY